MNPKRQKNRHKTFVDKNPIEAVRDIGAGVTSSLVQDVGKGIVTDLWKQMLGTYEDAPSFVEQLSGELQEGQEIDLASLRKEKAKPFAIEPGINYQRELLYAEKKQAVEDRQAIEVKMQEIIIELKRLTQTSKLLEVEFREVTQEQRIPNVGRYHLSFFEWMLSVVRTARTKVEDAGAWLEAVYAKKRKRGYWTMFRKHGTTFGLSHERVVATQTG